MAHFTLKQLKYFVTVVEAESIAQASRQLYIAQPSVSMAIKNLEDNFAQQLFIRQHAHGVSLTPGGRRFYHKAKELLRLCYEFEQNSRADNDLIAGTISVGFFESAAPLYFPRIISSFRKMYPLIEIKIYDGEQHELVQGLHRGYFDLAFLYDLELNDSLQTLPIQAPNKPYALLPAGHPLAARPSVTLAELSREPLILLDVVPSKNYFLNIFRDNGYYPTVAWKSPSIEMVRAMVGQGLGFSLLVTRPVNNVTYDGHAVVQVEIKNEMADSTLVIARLRNNQPTRPVTFFMDFCQRINLMPQEII